MRYLSLFSGIEAASVAWDSLEWEPVAFCEIDPFPCAVLEYRYPDVPNLGDITEVDWDEFKARYGSVDLVVGGSPCQSFSIAGGREGLDGESRLMYEYIRAVSEVRPTWFLWENVPGVFSTDAGRAFGILLDEMEKLGYGLAWATLDAQFFGVAQRRRRVFLVGYIGNVGAATAVLFESDSVRGNTLTSREKRAQLAADSASGFRVGGFKWNQGSRAGGVGFMSEQSPTLVTEQAPAICLQSDGSTSTNSHGGGTSTTAQRTPSTQSTEYQSRSPKTSAARSDWRDFDGSRTGALAANPDFNKGQGASLICMVNDTCNAAIDVDVSGTILAGGGSPPIVSALYAQGTTRGRARTMWNRES